MSGESDLGSLLRHMNPRQVPGEYVFCSIDESQVKIVETPLLTFREDEGVTVIIPRQVAKSLNLGFDSVWGFITLSIHSDLAAVGFLATITRKLADAGISVNVVSAFYHDHLFVPYPEVERTMAILEALSRDQSE
ncbi:MAG: ACT domain-containing protein [Candidatus Thorarchaeota archaeon]